MKRVLVIPLIILMAASMACSMLTPKPTAAPIVPTATKAVVEAEQATPTEPPAAQPTDTEAVPTDVPATEPPAATETAPQPASFKDTFNMANSNWSDPFIVTSQAAGHDPFVKVTVGGGKMRFAIDDKETYVYKFLPKSPDGASTIEVDFQNKGMIDSGIAIVCKANQEKTSWFEMRVSAANNYYNFYKYDKSIKENEGKNPYVLLGKGHMKADEYFPTKINHIVLSCTEDALTLDVNNGKKKASQALDTKLDGTMMGVGVMSAALTPAAFDFTLVYVH